MDLAIGFKVLERYEATLIGELTIRLELRWDFGQRRLKKRVSRLVHGLMLNYNNEKKNPNNRNRTSDRLISALFYLYSQALYQLSYVRKVTNQLHISLLKGL